MTHTLTHDSQRSLSLRALREIRNFPSDKNDCIGKTGEKKKKTKQQQKKN